MKRIALLSLLASLVATAPAGAARPQASDVYRFADGSAVAGASSQLVRTPTGVSFTLHTSGLPAGDAVTIWWVIFNNPSACSGVAPGHPFRCGLPDLFNPATQASVQYAAGHVVGTSGPVSWGGSIRTGDTSGCAFGTFDCVGLIAPTGADVHLVVQDHGPADPAIVADEIHSFGVCNPSCVDVQFAVHESS